MAETSSPKPGCDKYFKAWKAIFLVALAESGRKPVWSTPEALVLHLLWDFPVSHVIQPRPVSCLCILTQNQRRLPSMTGPPTPRCPFCCSCAIIFNCSQICLQMSCRCGNLSYRHAVMITQCSHPWGWGVPFRLEGHWWSIIFVFFSPQGCELFRRFYSHKNSLDLSGRHWALIGCFLFPFFFPSRFLKGLSIWMSPALTT